MPAVEGATAEKQLKEMRLAATGKSWFIVLDGKFVHFCCLPSLVLITLFFSDRQMFGTNLRHTIFADITLV